MCALVCAQNPPLISGAGFLGGRRSAGRCLFCQSKNPTDFESPLNVGHLSLCTCTFVFMGFSEIKFYLILKIEVGANIISVCFLLGGAGSPNTYGLTRLLLFASSLA